MDPESRVFVAGHGGLVGSAILRRLTDLGYHNLITASRAELDLRDQMAVNHWFRANRPEFVFLVAGTVGGILANSTYPANFIYDNLMIHATVVEAAWRHDVEKLLYLGSSCIYPRECSQPITEDMLPTKSNMTQISSRPCPRISTDRTTTSISRALTSCRR